MPCIYTHKSFGKEVAKRLPKDLQKIVYKHKDEFQIGLQGPDFLFFYRPITKSYVNQLGYWLHNQTMAYFLNKQLPYWQKRKPIHSGTYAYLLGFICHFILDSECHPFVIAISQSPKYNHLAIENEFDRYWLKKENYKATTYPMWNEIKITPSIMNAIYHAYLPFGLSKKEIKKSLQSMRFFKWILTSGCSIKRILVRCFMKLTLHYNELEGHMMNLRPKKYSIYTNQKLEQCYNSAIPLAVKMIVDFHKSVMDGKKLHPRFSTTFKDNTQTNQSPL